MTNHRLPTGFLFGGIHAGIKPKNLDLGLVIHRTPLQAFGVYTQNLVRAACIDWNRSLTPGTEIRGVLFNSGNANACTGAQGVENNRRMSEKASVCLQSLGYPTQAQQLMVLSTGVIGFPLPMQQVESGIEQLVKKLGSDRHHFEAAATAILTTDHNMKVLSVNWEQDGREFVIAGIAKGAGMIGPNMATMLGILMTDFPIPFEQGQSILKSAVNQSFNCISVEGHTSTNDAVILLSPPKTDNYLPRTELFAQQLHEVCQALARKIPTDGEGASHLIHIEVTGAMSDQQADRIARTIALSNLVKTAVAGADPNWGRIVSAAGYAGCSMDVSKTNLILNGLTVFQNGNPIPFDKPSVSRSIRDHFDTRIELSVGDGPGRAVHWTSDLTVDYVKLNAEYTT